MAPFGSMDAEYLILGSYPSVISLQEQHYYANPTNRFWKVMDVLDISFQLWDVIQSCSRKGSSDASIQDVVVNDIASHVAQMPNLKKILCNGKLSYQLMRTYFPELDCVSLPSTSAANARYRLEDLIECYQKEILDE